MHAAYGRLHTAVTTTLASYQRIGVPSGRDLARFRLDDKENVTAERHAAMHGSSCTCMQSLRSFWLLRILMMGIGPGLWSGQRKRFRF